MGRGRGKGKKQSIAARNDTESGEDEKLPVRRRGRPQKPMKDEFDSESEAEKIDQYEDGEESKLSKNEESERKRKRVKGGDELVKEECKNNAAVLIKSAGFRQHGSRRKSKPRRAAEVGVECK